MHINRYTIDALRVQECDQLLEIGMGNGFFVSEILTGHPLVKYVGCDFSPVMVREAEIMNERFITACQAEFCLTSAEILPFDDGIFDKVFSVNTIFFWDDSRLILSEIRRVLKPAGEIIISVRPKATMEALPFVKYGFNTFSKEDLKALLIQSFMVTAVIEKREPDQEINGDKIPMESLIVWAMK
ncbi:MAG: class I SAM-dependent methyltransferase [Cyclobacteriaceae bacterium]